MAAAAKDTAASTTLPPVPPPPLTDDVALQERTARAEQIVRRNIFWAMGVGAIPLPIVDFIGISAVQVKMLKQLSDEYQIPFREHKVKNLVSSLLTGTASTGIGAAISFGALKLIPVVGAVAGFVAVPIAAGALTYGTGKVFIQHFESGGTFLDFDPEKVRAYFTEEVSRGRVIVTKMHTESTKAP